MNEKQDKDFENINPEELSLFQEFVQMLKHNKKYWMIPIVLMLLGFGVLLILGSTGAAPFIYTLF
ncbi:MAG TPA: DUF5989 family protein [Verrucomicrobiota bacterium]|nr:DUF5989 family protein [Verrucomicrobiota bacterium]